MICPLTIIVDLNSHQMLLDLSRARVFVCQHQEAGLAVLLLLLVFDLFVGVFDRRRVLWRRERRQRRFALLLLWHRLLELCVKLADVGIECSDFAEGAGALVADEGGVLRVEGVHS